MWVYHKEVGVRLLLVHLLEGMAEEKQIEGPTTDLAHQTVHLLTGFDFVPCLHWKASANGS